MYHLVSILNTSIYYYFNKNRFNIGTIYIIVIIYSCNVGDFVLVVWDTTYKNYTVYQESDRNLVFLHPDSIDSLSLKLGPGK